jgi:hypothetical protein
MTFDEAKALVCDCAPWAVRDLRHVLARLLADPRATADALLIVADALQEAARETETFDLASGMRWAGLEALADLLRSRVPTHRPEAPQ